MAYQGGASTRPPLVSAAGILLIVAGALGVLLALLALGAAGGAVFVFVLIPIIIGAASIWAGLQVLQLREQGRMLGLVIAGIGALFALLALIQGAYFSLINLALYGFVIYALVTQAAAFRRA
jgi:hypothetical protein